MKAAVFGDDQLYEKTKQTAKRWAAEDAGQMKPVKPEPVDPAVKREALTKVVHLYMQMNAHPRAWALIDAHREAFENPDELRKKVEKDWLAVVKDVSRAAEKVVLYGHEVYPKGDPLKVTIPWALSDEAMASVRKRLNQLDNTAPANTQPDTHTSQPSKSVREAEKGT